MNKSASLIARVLLVFLGLRFVVGSKEGDVSFKVRINEKGTRFIEKIRINEKENTVSFMVPKHNDVDYSEVLNEFNLNLTITRLPDVGVCYIKPLDKSLPNPKKMKSDISYVRRMHGRIKKSGTLLSSTEWAIDKKLEAKDLHPTVVKFCAGLPVYRLKEITKDNWEIEQERTSNDTRRRSKRQQEKRTNFPMCTSSLDVTALPCTPDEWKMYCKLVGRTCVYWALCDLDLFLKTSFESLNDCNFKHNYSSLVCCEFRCPSK